MSKQTSTGRPVGRPRKPRELSAQDEQDKTERRDFFRLLQLFPLYHPAALLRAFDRCNKDIVRTIDNILYAKRYTRFIRRSKVKNEPQSSAFTNNNSTTFPKQELLDTSSAVAELDKLLATYTPNGSFDGISQQLQNTLSAPDFANYCSGISTGYGMNSDYNYVNNSVQNNCFGFGNFNTMNDHPNANMMDYYMNNNY